MDVFLVVPERMQGPQLMAATGWTVLHSLHDGLLELDARYKGLADSRCGRRKGLDPVLLRSSIPDERFFEHCHCEAGSRCSHSPWIEIDSVNLSELKLRQPLRGWSAVTQEDVVAWEIERRLVTRWQSPKFLFRCYWFDRMPITG